MLNTKAIIVTGGLAFSLVFSSCTKKEQKVEEAVTTTPPVVEPGTSEQDLGSLTSPLSTSVPESSEYTIYFDFDDYTISEASRVKLDKLANELKSNSGWVVQIEGHCDERGTTEYNLALGERRAKSAQKYLVSQGIDVNRLSTITYGEEKPAVDGHDEEAWSKNRRAEFVISGQ